VVLDPELTRSATASQRATSGIDALCQALESLWATAATDESRDLARRGAALVLGHIEPFVEHASSSSAAAMSLGSHLAGRAINLTKTTGPHAMSYGLTMRHGIPHGHAVALTFGAFLEVHANAGTERLQEGVDADAHRAAMAEITALLDARDGSGARRRFTDLLGRLALETRPSELGVTGREEYVRLAASVNTERLSNNPVALGQDDLVRLLASTNAEPAD
jgi:alcohol dehydrogenase